MNENTIIYKVIFGFFIGLISILIAASLGAIFEIPFLLLHGISVFIAIFIVTLFFAIINLLKQSTEEIIEKDKAIINYKTGRISRNRFVRLAIDAVKSPILLLDAQRHVLIANKAARARFSIPKSGIRLEQFLRNPEVLKLVDEAIKEGNAKQILWESYFPTISFERVEISTFVVDGAIRIILIFNDETDMHKAEQMRVDFLANAGHELRTPLASIRGFLETIQDSAKDDKAAIERFLPIMSREAERMSRLINDILSLSKIELNEHISPETQIDLIEIINSAIITSEPQAKKNNNEINLFSENEKLNAIADKDELQQIILNLIDNAIKYGNKDCSINIYARQFSNLVAAQEYALRNWLGSNYSTITSAQETANNFALIRVENYGKAIAAHYLPRLSERFYRIDDESAHIRGTGLGLAIVKHIVKRHNGGFYVETIKNEKIAFTIILKQK